MLLHECTSPTGLRPRGLGNLQGWQNCDGYFDCADLCAQTEKVIELFEDNFSGTAVAAFGFDNAPGHQKCADNALSAHHMPNSKKGGLGNMGSAKCGRAHFQMGPPTTFIIQRITQICQGGSKVWKLFLRSKVFLSRVIYRQNVQISSVKTSRGLLLLLDIIQPAWLPGPETVCFELVEANGHIAFFILNSIVN